MGASDDYRYPAGWARVLSACFCGFSESFPDHVAIRNLDAKEETVTYRELRIKAEECNGALKNLGVLPGDKVAVVLPNGVECLACIIGAKRSNGSTPCNVSLRQAGETLRRRVSAPCALCRREGGKYTHRLMYRCASRLNE